MTEYTIDNVAKKIIIITDNPRSIRPADIVKIHKTEKVIDFGIEIKLVEAKTN